MKYSLIVLLFLLVITVNIAVAREGYSIDQFPLQNGTSDVIGADATISFFELPLWVQLVWILSSIIAIFGVIKFGPIIIEKVKVILQNENRAAMLEYIGNNPGCTLADLWKNIGLNRGTARYHLYLLLIERRIFRKTEGKLSYLFINGGTRVARTQMYGYIMNPSKREILETILDKPGICNKEIADCLQTDPSTVHWHLQQLLEEEMVVSHRDGRIVNYILFPDVEVILRKLRK
jgi:predicted transcriptional regulator